MLRDLISAFELIRKLNVDPAPRPTFRNVTTARAFKARSAPRLFTVISKLVACHAARSSSCACASDNTAKIRIGNRSEALRLIINCKYEFLNPCVIMLSKRSPIKLKGPHFLLEPCFPAPGRTAHVINQRLNIAQILEQTAQARER